MQTPRKFMLIVAVAAALMLSVLPAAAQATQPDTITVTGTGQASAQPDFATLEIGVESSAPEATAAFSQTNATLEAVIAAVVAAGVDAADVQTSNLNIYSRTNFDPMTQMETLIGFNVSNTVRVTVRDVSSIETVVDAASGAGANQLYGLTFGIEDRAALESQARADAVTDARAKAEELAGLIGASLGQVVSVREYGISSPFMPMAQMGLGGGGGAVIEPGQSSVSVEMEVVFGIVR